MNKHIRQLTNQPMSLYMTLFGVTFFGLIFLYMYFLSMSVVHVVLRKEVIHKASTVESEIATLEATYIDAQHKVSDKIAALENFTETDAKVFVTRGTEPTLVFSGNGR